MPRLEATNDGALLKGRNIGVKRSNRWIIRYVDVDIYQGNLVSVCGANGAGKSTFLKSILGLIDIDEGKVERARSIKIGYVPQRLTMSPTLPLTLRRLMTLTGHYPGQEIDLALSAVGLDRLGNPPVTTLSGGEFQRLLLARAMIDRPNLLVLDEPAQGLDLAGADLLYSLINDIRADLNCGVIMVSHDLEKAVDLGDDVVMLVPHEHDEPPLIQEP